MAFQPPQIKNIVNKQTFHSPSSQIALYSIVIVLFSWFVLKPAITNWNEKKTTLKVEKENFEKIDGQRSSLNKLISELDSKKEDIKLLDEALPLNEEVARLHILLNGFVAASGMQLSQVSVDLSKIGIQVGDKKELENQFGQKRALTTIPITLSVSGSIEQLKNVLQLVETDGRFFEISNIDVSKGKETTNFQLQLRAYAYDTEKNEIK